MGYDSPHDMVSEEVVCVIGTTAYGSAIFLLAFTAQAANSYLGSWFTLLGITNGSIQTRIWAAKPTLQKQKQIEQATLLLHHHTKLTLFKSFLLPAIDFGLHLNDISTATRHLRDSFEKNALHWIPKGLGRSTLQRAQGMTRIL